MKIYFTIASIPELKDLAKGERRVAWYACRAKVASTRVTLIGTVLGLIAGGALGTGLLLIALDHLPHRGLLRFFVGGFACGVLTIGLTDYFRSLAISSQLGPHLAEFLEARSTRNKTRVKIEFATAPFDEGDDPASGN